MRMPREVPVALLYLRVWSRARSVAALRRRFAVAPAPPVTGTLYLVHPVRRELGPAMLDADGEPVLHDLALARVRAALRWPAGGNP